MIKRIAGIVFVFVCVAAAWLFLGATVEIRTRGQDSKLRGAVGQLWGVAQHQEAPSAFYVTREPVVREESAGGEGEGDRKRGPRFRDVRHDLPLAGTVADADLHLEQRRKGLLWYPTYRVRFSATYRIANPTSEAHTAVFCLPLPARDAVYDDFRVEVGGSPLADVPVNDAHVRVELPVPAGGENTVAVAYTSQGMDDWWYAFGASVRSVRDFRLTVRTDFEGVDFPLGAMAPTEKAREGKGWRLTWSYANLLSGVQVGVAMPRKLNPGPWVSEVTFAAPVSLFLYFFLIFIVTTRRGIRLHPMHYFFVGAAYFSFHLMLAYLVDHLPVWAAFTIASAVSLGLVASYLRLVAGPRFAFAEAGIAQAIYQVLFSATFFLEAYTGLSITILCVLTLAVVMQATARVDWEALFRQGGTAGGLVGG